jgi:DNA-binding MarR family transcriptional regulator
MITLKKVSESVLILRFKRSYEPIHGVANSYGKNGSLDRLKSQYLKEGLTENHMEDIIESRHLDDDNIYTDDLSETSSIEWKDVKDLPPKDYVIERFGMTSGSLTTLCATGYSGKTFFAQYLATCIASGVPLFGKYPTSHGEILHIDQEQSNNQTVLRYNRIFNGLGVKPFGIKRTRLNYRFDDRSSNINEVKSRLVEQFKGKRLVIIDSLKKISSADENSADIERVLNMLKHAAEQSNTAILLIHHKGKSSNGAKQTGRGHSSIYDAVDIQIDLSANDAGFDLSWVKNRDGKIIMGMSYDLIDVGEVIESQNCSSALEFKLIADDIKPIKINSKESLLGLLIEGPANQGQINDALRGQRANVKKLVKALFEDGFIDEQRGAKNALIYSITDKGRREIEESDHFMRGEVDL